MNQNKFLAPLVCGFGAAALTTIPGLRSATCCLFVPLAAALSIIIYKRVNPIPFVYEDEIEHQGIIEPTKPKFRTSTAIYLGLLTGLVVAVFSTFFDTIITLITHTNEFVETLPQTQSMMKDMKLGEIFNQTMGIMKSMASDIRNNGFSFFYTFGIFFSNIFIDAIFGMAGGLLGLLFVNKRK